MRYKRIAFLRRRALVLLLLYPVMAVAGQVPRTLRLAFIGDIMAHDVNYVMADYSEIYSGVRVLLKGADLAFANLEFPVDATLPASSYPSFNATRGYWKAAVDAGISVFSLANNHAFDQGEEGVFQTLRSAAELRRASGGPLHISGIRGNPARPFEPETILVRGVRIGFLAVTQLINQSGPCPYVNIVDYTDPEAADALVLFLRRVAPAYDLFVVSYHGGTEYAERASAEKAAFFRRLLENGAHVVFGHHPHVFQGFELFTVNGETRLSLLSMGNFISGMTWGADPAEPDAPNAATGDSAVLLADMLVTRGGAYLTRAQVVPVSNYMNRRGEMVVGSLEGLAAGTPGLSASWTAYFRRRLDVLRPLLRPLAGVAEVR